MGSGGTEWESNDIFNPDRMNQKTRFVGTHEQISNLITNPQVGQTVYSTESDDTTFPEIQNSTFPKDNFQIRNAANDAWKMRHLTETEGSDGTTPTGANNAIANNRVYDFFTLPTTEKFYTVYKIDAYTGNNSPSAKNITYQFGVDIVDADPPVSNHTTLVGITPKVTTNIPANTNLALPDYPLVTDPIRGGTVIGVWGIATVGFSTQRIGEYSGPSENVTKASGFVNDFAEDTAWATGTDHHWVKIYYRGYS